MGLERYQHYLKDNKNTEFPYHFIFFDTETQQSYINDRDIEHTLKLGTAVYWRRPDAKNKEILHYYTFWKVEDFWDFVWSKCTQKRRIVIVSHNLPFDMGIVKGWQWLDRNGFKSTKIILDYQCNIWRFRKDTTTLLFIDNMNFFQTSLEILGESIGVKKLPLPAQGEAVEHWLAYCSQDVQILLKAWQMWFDFLQTNDLGSFGYTIASQALNAFRHRFMPQPISIHTSNKAIALERMSYRGGRNECFRIGEYHGKEFYLLDVNSMYSYVMVKHEYPYNLISTGVSLSCDKAKELLKDYCLIALCHVKTEQPCFGIKLKDKLLFPVGEFTVALTTNEIIKGLAEAKIIAINDYALYEKAKLFQDYVNFFYTHRLVFERRKSIAYAYLCKIMLNALYGKFGQRIEEWNYVCDDATRDYDWWQEYDFQKKRVFTYRCINHRVEASVGFKEGFNSLVAISSEVTANARLYLWELINLAGLYNVYYCDTDSMIINQGGFDALSKRLHHSGLGMLKVVDQTDRISIHGLKDYSFGGKVKIKGIRKDAEMISYNKYKQLQSLGIKSGLHQRDINRVIWREVTKDLKRDYSKGVLLPDGRVMPIILFDFDGMGIRDWSAMREAYGSESIVGGREVERLYTDKLVYGDRGESAEADMRPGDRIANRLEKQQQRRDGEMLYQRGL